MENLSNLVFKVLSKIEKDPEQWSYWTQEQTLSSISSSDVMKEFVQTLETIKKKGEKVIVAGDYDCDGIMATTIMVDGLRRYGIECGFYIPDRIHEGYGLQVNTVHLAHKKGYSWIITVDNGVKAFPALLEAKQLGMHTIVTDHHILEEEVPSDLLVHPTLMEPEFSSLCGAALAYECIRSLHQDTSYHLQLASIASIGDCMQVKGQTRAIIQQGLKLLNSEKETHLIHLARDASLDETSVGFQIVPKLNAVGRLSNLANVNNVVRYFLSKDHVEITNLRQQIQDLNEHRKKLSDQMCRHALKKCQIQNKVLIVSDPSYHEGIIGLVAGSLCEKTKKPAIVLAQNAQGFKASMRCPEGFNCMDFLSDFDQFQAMGGHPQACGFSLDLQAYPAFVQYIKERSLQYTWQELEKDTLKVTEDQLTLAEVQSLDQLRPFGPGFECPLFEIEHPLITKINDFQNRKHRKYILSGGLECVNFNQSDKDRDQSLNSIQSLIGKVQVSQYRGRKNVSFVIQEIVYS